MLSVNFSTRLSTSPLNAPERDSDCLELDKFLLAEQIGYNFVIVNAVVGRTGTCNRLQLAVYSSGR